MRTEDGYIIHKCLNGDPAAFGLLVDKYKASIYALAYSKLRNFHDAEDITQQAFIKAYQKLRTLRWWDNFLAWLYAITSNLCTDWIRSQSKRPDREFVADQGPDVLDHPSMDSYHEGLARESLHEALDSLPEIYRQVLTLYYLGGMSTREIARFLRTSPNAIAQRLRRARAKLKEEMIAMMSKTYEKQKLQADFTFRIVEMVKQVKIQPVPRVPWLPWGLSAATGIIIAVLSFTSPLISLNPVRMGSVTPTGERVELLSHRLDMDESYFGPYSQTGEVLTYADIPITLETIPRGSDQSPTAKPVGASPADQGSGQTPQPEQTSLAAAAPAVTTDAEEKITILGKVLKDDVPVPNARVYIYDRDGEIIKEDGTRIDGSFQLEIPKPKNWERLTAVAEHPQYSFGWARLSEDNAANVVVKLRQPAAISGTITDEWGNPIQGADVQIGGITFPFPKAGIPRENYLLGEAVPAGAVKTKNDGVFTFRNLPEGSGANVDIVGPGYARERKFNIQAGMEGLTLILKREARIEGRVTFGETGEPAEGIKVSAGPVYPTEGWANSQTDENGYYALTNLPAGEYDVFLGEKYPDWTAAAKEYVKGPEGQVIKNMDLKLVKGGFITGKVTYKDTNEPIPDHGISFYDASRPESQASIHGVNTDEKGFFRFRAAPGKAKVYTSAPGGYQFGYAEEYVDVIEGQTISDVNFQFQKVAQLIIVTGRTISSDGEPVAGAVITDKMESYKQYGISDKDGKFTIIGLQPGQKLSVKAEQKELQLRAYTDVVVRPDLEIEILMEEYQTVSMSGRVVNGQGMPIASADIGLMRWDKDLQRGIGTSAGMTNSLGEYTITGLIVGDEYRVSASAEGYRDGGMEMFTATADMSRLGDIVLLPTGEFFLQGRVTDTDGKLVVRAWVTARSADSRTKTDENGYYRLDNLTLKIEIEVSIDHPDYGHNSFKYVPTNQTRDFVIVRAERYLAGKVVDADGDPVAGAAVIIEPQHDMATGHRIPAPDTNLRGEFRLEHIVNERVSVSVSSNVLRFSKTFENVETNRDDVVFVLDKSLEPPKEPPTAEQIARREYRDSARERLQDLAGKPAPELDVAQWLHGEPTTIAELKGKVVVLHFWSGLAGGYFEVMHSSPELIRFLNMLQEEYGENGLVCIGIYRFTTQIDELKKAITESNPAYRIAVDKESPVVGARGVTFDRYADPWMPILIDREGVIYGKVWDHELEEKIQELL